jgi:glycerol-3-phosphate responsive antiterminator
MLLLGICMIANTYYEIQIKRGKNFWIHLSLIASMNMTTDIGEDALKNRMKADSIIQGCYRTITN